MNTETETKEKERLFSEEQMLGIGVDLDYIQNLFFGIKSIFLNSDFGWIKVNQTSAMNKINGKDIYALITDTNNLYISGKKFKYDKMIP